MSRNVSDVLYGQDTQRSVKVTSDSQGAKVADEIRLLKAATSTRIGDEG